MPNISQEKYQEALNLAYRNGQYAGLEEGKKTGYSQARWEKVARLEDHLIQIGQMMSAQAKLAEVAANLISQALNHDRNFPR